MAIMACAQKAHNAYGTRYDTANQYATVIHWSEKWLKQRYKCRERASAWNKTHKERHCELNKKSYARKKQLQKTIN